jgi:hypothetical protein
MYRLKLRIRFVLSDRIARQKTRFFVVLTPPAAARRAHAARGCAPGLSALRMARRLMHILKCYSVPAGGFASGIPMRFPSKENWRQCA